MKIGFFCTEFPKIDPRNDMVLEYHPIYGVEIGNFEIAKRLAKRGHELFIFTTSISREDSVDVYDNIHIYRYGTSFKIGQCPISLSLLWKPIFLDIDLDILHLRLGNLPAPLTGYLYSIVKKKNIITSYHGDYDGSLGGIFRKTCVFLYNRLICDLILSKSQIIIALSEYHATESIFLRKYLKKMVYIPNGLNIEKFDLSYTKSECREKLRLPKDKKIILFVGSFSQIKAPDILIKAMKIILDKIPDAYLVIAGEGPMMKELIELAKKLTIESSILFPGYIYEEKYKYYKSADLFVLTSRHESFGNVLLEASASGLPIVASDIKSIRVIVHDTYNGLFAQIGDEIDFARKIVYLLENDDVRQEMGENARKISQSFSWDASTLDLEEIFIKIYNDKIQA